MEDSELKRRVKAEYVRLRQNHWQKKSEETKTDEDPDQIKVEMIDKKTGDINSGPEGDVEIHLSVARDDVDDVNEIESIPEGITVINMDNSAQVTDNDRVQELQDIAEIGEQQRLKRSRGEEDNRKAKSNQTGQPEGYIYKKLRVMEDLSLEPKKYDIDRLRDRRKQLELSLEQERIEIEIKETQRLQQLQSLEREKLELERKEKERFELQQQLEQQRNDIEKNLKLHREKCEQLERQKMDNTKREELRLQQLEKLDQEIIVIEAKDDQDEDQESVENELFPEFAVSSQSPLGSENTSEVAKSVLDALSPFMNQVTGLLGVLNKKMQACEVRLAAVEAALRFQRTMSKPRSSVVFPSSDSISKAPVSPSTSYLQPTPLTSSTPVAAVGNVQGASQSSSNNSISSLLTGLTFVQSTKIKGLIAKCKDRYQLTRYLLDLFFKLEELANSNHDGVMGKLKLDETRLDLVQKIAFAAFPVQEMDGELYHAALKKFKAEVNAKCRSRRYDLKQTAYNTSSEDIDYKMQKSDS